MKEENIAINRLKCIRTKHGMSQAQLAEAVGMKQSMINRIETQNANLTIQNAIKICKLLGEPLEDLWEYTYKRELEKAPRFDFLGTLKYWQLEQLKDAIDAELIRRKEEEYDEE